MSEWEITGAARSATADRRTEFSGSMVIKHTGACTANGPVEKAGEIRFRRTGLLSSRIEGVITLADEQCAFEVRESTHDGLMRCLGKGAVPISLEVR